MYKTNHIIWTFKYVSLLNLSAIPCKPSSSRLEKNDRFNNTMEVMEFPWRKVDNASGDKSQPQARRKDFSSCSDPIPCSNPLSAIFSQKVISSSWSLQHISNKICQRTQNSDKSQQPGWCIDNALYYCSENKKIILQLE